MQRVPQLQYITREHGSDESTPLRAVFDLRADFCIRRATFAAFADAV
jgi:hypothetical protein